MHVVINDHRVYYCYLLPLRRMLVVLICMYLRVCVCVCVCIYTYNNRLHLRGMLVVHLDTCTREFI